MLSEVDIETVPAPVHPHAQHVQRLVHRADVHVIRLLVLLFDVLDRKLYATLAEVSEEGHGGQDVLVVGEDVLRDLKGNVTCSVSMGAALAKKSRNVVRTKERTDERGIHTFITGLRGVYSSMSAHVCR